MEDNIFQILTELNEVIDELIEGEELTEFMDEREDKKSRKALYAAAGTAAAGAAGAAAFEKFRPGSLNEAREAIHSGLNKAKVATSRGAYRVGDSLHTARVLARRGAYRAGLAARLSKARAGEAARNAVPHLKGFGKAGGDLSLALLKRSLLVAAALGLRKGGNRLRSRRPAAMMRPKKSR